jgi:hypothetical protein
MSASDNRSAPAEGCQHGRAEQGSLPARRAVILTSYKTGATQGKNLGVPGYSYDIVAELFVPLLARWGEVIPTGRHGPEVEAAVRQARARGLGPVHVSFLPFQDVYLTPSAPNVVVPAWEFPDVPNEDFGDNPYNNWVTPAHQSTVVIVGGPFTVESFRRAGIRTPIRVVPVPTPQRYFDLPDWVPQGQTHIACSPLVFPNPDGPPAELWPSPPEPPAWLAQPITIPNPSWRTQVRQAYRRFVRPLVPPLVHAGLRRTANLVRKAGGWEDYLRRCRRSSLELSGVVYTTIFNPADGRKNYQDLLTAFVKGLHDCPDATLVLKLISSAPLHRDQVLGFYRGVGTGHRCRVVFINEYLSDAQMLDLARASTYYVTTTRAEGNCLPIMNYLAAGRPGISPSHTAISDYFDDEVGFTLPWHPEPCPWPQDSRCCFKSTWGRLVWPAVVEQLRRSYELARRDPRAYAALAARGRAKMASWCSAESIWPRLRDALDLAVAPQSRRVQAA